MSMRLAATKNLSMREEEEEEEEECLLRVCHVLESGSEKEQENLVWKMRTSENVNVQWRLLLLELVEEGWILEAHSDEMTILHYLVFFKCVRALEILLKGLMARPSKPSQKDGDEEDELLRRELQDFLSRKDRWGDTALHNIRNWGYDRAESEAVMRHFTEFCRDAIDVDSPGAVHFINKLLSIRSLFEDGRTVLTMLLAKELRRDPLEGFLDAMQAEVMRQAQLQKCGDVKDEEEEGGVDVSWLLTADDDKDGRTPFHYKYTRVVQILPPKHLRPHNLFKLCTAKDSLTGGTPLHGLRSESDAEFCSALAILSKQVQAFDDERKRRLRTLPSSSSSSHETPNNNIAINIFSSRSDLHETSAASSSIDGAAAAVGSLDPEVAIASTNVSSTSAATYHKHPSVHGLPKATVDGDFLHTLVHARDNDGRTPLHTASGSKCINALLRFGASVAEPDHDENDPLTAAFEGLFSQEVMMMMKRTISVEGEDWKVDSSEGEGGSMIIDVKAKRQTCDSLLQWACPLHDSTPNDSAAGQRMTRVEQMALVGVPTSIINKRIGRLGLTALHVAAGIGTSTRVDMLLEKGAHVNVRCSGGRTPLHLATSQGLSRLAAAVAFPDCSPSSVIERLTFCHKYNPLQLTESTSKQMKINLQLGLMLGGSMGKDFREALRRKLREYIDAQDFSGQTCLHNLLGNFATAGEGEEEKEEEEEEEREYIDTQSFSEILEHCIHNVGCRVDLGNRAGDTLLHVAVAKCKDAKMVKKIIGCAYRVVMAGHGSNPMEPKEISKRKREWLLMGNASEETALHVAVRKGKMDMVEELLRAAVEIEVDMTEMLWRRKDVLNVTVVGYMGEPSGAVGDCRNETKDRTTIDTYCCCWKHLKGKASQYSCQNQIVPPATNGDTKHAPPPPSSAAGRRNGSGLAPNPPRPWRLITDTRPWQQQLLHKDDPWLDLQRKLSDQPTLTDELDRFSLVMGIVELLLNPLTSTPITIGILGDWGAGKTSFMKQVDAVSLILNTPNEVNGFEIYERNIAEDGTVDVSPPKYSEYKAKAFLSGIRRDSVMSGVRRDSEGMIITLVNLIMNGPPMLRLTNRLATIVPTTCYNALQRLGFMRANVRMTANRTQSNEEDQRQKKHISIVTIWFNAWQYDGKTEASAGLALEVCKGLEGLMTRSQKLRMRCTYSWKMNEKGLLTSLVLPALLATGLIILALTLVKILHIPLRYGASMGVLGVIGLLFKALSSIAPPVSKAMTAYIGMPDHTVMLGYQHRVIKDIQFLQDQLCTSPSFPGTVVDEVWGLLGGNRMQGTKLRKRCPSKEDLRIVVFIDDIDRCDEKIVLELLRAINLVAIACGISVVLGANEKIVHRSILREFYRAERTCQCITEAAKLIQSKDDGIPATSLTQEENDLAQRFMQKIIQIPLRIVEPGDDELWKFVQGVTTHANGNSSENENESIQVQVDRYPVDPSAAAAGNANASKNGIVSPNLYERARTTDGITLHTATEYTTLRDLIRLTHGDRRLPREWKRFMNYHQLARSVLVENHERRATSKEPPHEFKGWRRLLILWMFVCWNWKTQMKTLIQEWNDLLIEMKRQLHEDKASALLGDVVGYYMEKKGWKDKHDIYPIKAHEKHIGNLEVLAWIKLYNTLRAHFDIPFNFIHMFEQFRYESNPLHLSFDHHKEIIM